MTDEFLVILQAYGHSVVPLIAWQTVDVVRTIELLDAELQRRSDEDVMPSFEEWNDGSFGHE